MTHHHHHHTHMHGGSCGSEGGGHCGHEESCGGYDEECDEMEDSCPKEKLLKLGKKAWKKLMVDKIKAELDRTHGEQLNQLAKLIAETKMKEWQGFKSQKEAEKGFEEQICRLMSSF